MPGPVHQAYEDPRKVLRTKVFHALVWVVLYKAITEHTVSEHVMAVLIYLLEQAIAVSDPPEQQDQVSYHFFNSKFGKLGQFIDNTCCTKSVLNLNGKRYNTALPRHAQLHTTIVPKRQ